MATEGEIREKFHLLAPALNERDRRLLAGAEAKAIGWGGVSRVARATGLSWMTVARGLGEVQTAQGLAPGRIRKPGGGRKRTSAIDPTLTQDLDRLVEPTTRGDPESPLRWTCKSTRVLARELTAQGHSVSAKLIAALLHELGYSLQGNRKTQEGRAHPDRNAQFEHINRRVRRQLKAGDPAISVDTKKKELVGNFKNAGREWHPQGEPQEVRVHDFLDPAKGKAIPYGVYDLGRNVGWVSVGVDHDTAQFAVATILKWWRQMGRPAYHRARSLLIMADSGGSNGSRLRLWKWELQKLADRTGLRIHVCHLPPGTSKWNKIEHRLFSYITRNWRGQPLLTHAAIVSLIANTRTQTGLKVRSCLDPGRYLPKIKITDEQLAQVRIRRDAFHGEWNYTIEPSLGHRGLR